MEIRTTAVVREVFEETGLCVETTELLADFGDQSYWLCKTAPGNVRLQERESCSFAWIDPPRLLETGFIMDLRRIQEVLGTQGISLGTR